MATVKESWTVQIEGRRKVPRPVTLYKLDASLAVASQITPSPGLGIGVAVVQDGRVVLPAIEDANNGYRFGIHTEGNDGAFPVMVNA